MAFKFLKSSLQKVIFFVALVVLMLVSAVAFLINTYWSPIVSGRLKDIVKTSTDGLYTINFDKAQLRIISGQIVISNITLRPDDAVYLKMKQAHIAPNNIYSLHVKKIVLSSIHPLNLYFNKKLDVGKIVFSAPELHVSYQLNHAKDTVLKDKRTIYQQISGSLKMIHIGKIMLNDVVLHYEDHKPAKTITTNLKDLNLSADDFLIDSASQFDKSRFLYCHDMNAELNNYSGKSINGLYLYSAKQITFSTLTSQLNAYHCSLISTKKLTDFFAKTYKDHFIFKLDSLQLNHFDFELYNKYHRLHASALMLYNGELNIFGNPRIDPKSLAANRINTFPNEAIFHAPINLKIDTTYLKKINLTYEEYSFKTKRAGKITFNDIGGNIYNITNDFATLSKNNIAVIKAHSRFMNKGLLTTEFRFNLKDAQRSFDFKGNLGEMKMSAVNKASVPLASIAIRSGTVKSLNFDFNANSRGSKGKVAFLYQDLKVHLYKADTAKLKMRHMRIASIIANNGIIKHNNPDTTGKRPRIINVNFNRPANFTFFKSVWQTLLSGLKPAVGFDAATQQNVKERMEEHERKKAAKAFKNMLKKRKKASEKR